MQEHRCRRFLAEHGVDPVAPRTAAPRGSSTRSGKRRRSTPVPAWGAGRPTGSPSSSGATSRAWSWARKAPSWRPTSAARRPARPCAHAPPRGMPGTRRVASNTGSVPSATTSGSGRSGAIARSRPSSTPSRHRLTAAARDHANLTTTDPSTTAEADHHRGSGLGTNGFTRSGRPPSSGSTAPRADRTDASVASGSQPSDAGTSAAAPSGVAPPWCRRPSGIVAECVEQAQALQRQPPRRRPPGPGRPLPPRWPAVGVDPQVGEVHGALGPSERPRAWPDRRGRARAGTRWSMPGVGFLPARRAAGGGRRRSRRRARSPGRSPAAARGRPPGGRDPRSSTAPPGRRRPGRASRGPPGAPRWSRCAAGGGRGTSPRPRRRRRRCATRRWR